MRLLYAHECLGSLGGAEANALITAGELRGLGHRVGLLHGPGTGKGEERWRETFDDLYPLGGDHADVVSQTIERFKPDVVYVHKLADLKALESMVRWGGPLVRMVHDHDIYCMRSYRYNYFTRRVCHRPASWRCVFPCGASVVKNRGKGLPLKWVSYGDKKREIALNKRFHRMLVVTTYMREELILNGFSRERIEIHPPVPRMGDESIRSSFSDRNLILYAGQIIRGKGVDILLRALTRVRSPFECVILGDGNHRTHCEKLSRRLGLENRVKFAGFVPQEELKGYFRECSVVAIPSVWPEPIATVGLEVMRYGLPVVAFDAGGISDWLKTGENGFLAPWMDEKAFAEGIDGLLRDKELAKEMGENGRRRVNKDYDFPEYIRGLEEMFEKVRTEASGIPDGNRMAAP